MSGVVFFIQTDFKIVDSVWVSIQKPSNCQVSLHALN